MKRYFLIPVLLLAGFTGMTQITDEMDFAFVLSPGATRANINDELDAPSNQSTIADGNTFIDENGLRAMTVKLIANYNLDEQWAISSGLYFNKIRLNVRNQDGSYIGTSVYHVNYLSIPALVKYTSEEVTDNLRITGFLGPSIDFKYKEEAQGSDFAHFMNFAHNRFDLDPTRGRNGENEKLNLFGGVVFSVHFQAGVEYSLGDHFYLIGGLNYQYRLSNLLNGNLPYNDPEKTPITETMTWKAHTLSFDLGVGYIINP